MIKNTKFDNIYFFSLVYFLLVYLTAISWHDKSYFAVFDIIFQTDPNINLITFAHGWGRHAVTHAFIEFFAIPFRALSYIASQLNFVENERSFRDLLGLAVSPLMSALTLIVLYKALDFIVISRFEKNVLTLIFTLSFSNLLFSIIPETYAISCFFISILFYFFIKESYAKKVVDVKPWILIGFLLTGTSITNVFIFSIVYLFSLHFNKKNPLLKSIVLSGVISMAILVSVVALYEFVHFAIDYPKGDAGNSAWIKKYMANDFYTMFHNFISLSSASISSFFPLHFHLENNIYCADESFICNKISFQNGLITTPALIKTLLFFLTIYFAYFKSKNNIKNKNLTALCIMVIAFNFALHIFMGDEMFLYAQHWIVALLFLLIPLLNNNKAWLISFVLLQCIFNIHFFLELDEMVAMTPLSE